MSAGDDLPVPDYAARLRQDGRTVAVIGAGNGIGRQAAHAFAGVGARVVCVDIDGDRARAVAAEIGGTPRVADVTVGDEVRGLFDAPEVGPVHTVIDVVGLGPEPAPLESTSEAAWDATFALNLRQCFLVMQAGGAAIRAAGGGSMVFVSSMIGITAAPRVAAYGAAKAALISLVRSAAVELGPTVRVNCIAPARTMTPRLAAGLDDDERAAYIALQPVGRLGEPSDQAGVMLFLASDLAGYMTGQCLLVDGGLLLQVPSPFRHWPGERPNG